MGEAILNFLATSGLASITWQQAVMLLVSFVLMYLAIVKQYEPLLLLPIAFGMFLANMPLGGIADDPSETVRLLSPEFLAPYLQQLGLDLSDKLSSSEMLSLTNILLNTSDSTGAALLAAGEHLVQNIAEDGSVVMEAVKSNYGGVVYYLRLGVKLGIYPPLIFLGVGAMTDFGPLLANPKSILLGGAAQLGIFGAFFLAILLGFTPQEAGSIVIIGGADGPTALFTTARLAEHLLGPIAVAAYSYMALIPMIQPPLMRLMTTDKERKIKMKQLRKVSKTEKVIFPIVVATICALLLPDTAPLIGMLMLGNLFRESGVVDRLSDVAQNALCNICTIFLGLSVGATAKGDIFLKPQTLAIIALGLFAFCFGTLGGLMIGKILCLITHGKINPLIGSAGVSAVPMAARVSQNEGAKYDRTNFLLMHAMGPNVAGVIGSAVAAGFFLIFFG